MKHSLGAGNGAGSCLYVYHRAFIAAVKWRMSAMQGALCVRAHVPGCVFVCVGPALAFP